MRVGAVWGAVGGRPPARSVASDTVDRPRSYTVVGVGAIGGVYGARLHAAGHDVRWEARSDASHLRTQGLVVTDADGRRHHTDLAVHGPGEETPPRSDVVLVCTKTTAGVAALVGALADDATIVVAMQNGLGVEAALAAAAPGATVLGAMCFICAQKVGPGEVAHLDYGTVTLGEHRPGGDAAGITPAVEAVAADLEGAGVPVVREPDLERGRWRKLVWNIPFNGLSVVLDAGTDDLVADPDARGLVETLMREVVAASVACGHGLGEEIVAKLLADTEAMTPYAPSMKLDHDAGRPMELAAIYDAPLAAARAAGTDMPATAALAAQLHFLDRRARC